MEGTKTSQSRKKTRTAPQIIMAKFVFLPVGVFVLMLLIFPGVSLLTRVSGLAKPGDLASCTVFPFESVAIILVLLAGTSVVWAMAFRNVDSALYAMAWAFPVVATFALWFYLAGMGIMLCTRLPLQHYLLFATNGICLIAVAAGCLTFIRTRLPTVVDANPQKWDFAAMKYSLLAPVLPIDRDRKFTAGRILAVLVAFGGAQFVIERTLHRYMPIAKARDWEGVMLLIALAYGGVLAMLGQAYTMWIVYKRCKTADRKMTIKEFSR